MDYMTYGLLRIKREKAKRKHMKKINALKKYAAINLPSREVKLTDSLEESAPWTHLLTGYDYTIDNSTIKVSGMNNSTGETCSIVMTNYILII